MTSYSHLNDYLLDGLSEPSLVKARKSLRAIIDEFKDRTRSSELNENIFRLGALAYGHLASLEDIVQARTKMRTQAWKACVNGLENNPASSILAATYANAAVDWFYDPFAEKLAIRSKLSGARKTCEKLLKTERGNEFRLQLFVQLSSVLRCQAHIHGKQGGFALAQKALSTAKAACETMSRSGLAFLSVGLSFQSLARWAEDESRYFEWMQESETALLEAHAVGLPLAALCLSRLYRQTYRPDEAITWFLTYSREEPTRRRLVLADSHIAAEASVLLLHRNLDPIYVKERLMVVDALISEAITCGYNNARQLISLARIRFALGDEVGGLDFLGDILRQPTTDWNLAVETARQAIEEENFDFLVKSFALGIADGAVWNSLGTFANEVLSDSAFAIRLYTTGLKLSPTSAILHTNIARIYLEQAELIKAKRHLEVAGRHADFSFRWWKPIYDVVCKQLKGTPERIYGYRRPAEGDSLDLLYAEFLKLEQEQDKRGSAVENLLIRLLKLTFGTHRVMGSTDLRGVQSDATFKFGSHFYRAEISWEKRPNDRTQLDDLLVRLRRSVETRGLLVSLSGFTSGLREEAKLQKRDHVIILMDGDDFRRILRGEIRMEAFMEEKELEWFFETDPN